MRELGCDSSCRQDVLSLFCGHGLFKKNMILPSALPTKSFQLIREVSEKEPQLGMEGNVFNVFGRLLGQHAICCSS